MKKIKFLAIVAVCMVMFFVLTSCAPVAEEAVEENIAGENIAAEDVAVVNGVALKMSDFNALLSEMTGVPAEEIETYMSAEELAAYKNEIVEEMILQELMWQYAQEKGLDVLTEQEQQVTKDSAADSIEKVKESIRTNVEAEAQQDSTINVDEKTQSEFDAMMEQYGYTQESLVQRYTKQTVLNKVFDNVISKMELSDKTFEQYYDDLLKEQKELSATEPDTALQNYVGQANAVNVYTPDAAETSVKYVKNVLIKLPDDVLTGISALEEEGKVDEAEALKKEELEKIKGTADEVWEKAQNGDDFEALIGEYNEDTGMEYYPEGYMVFEGAPFDENFLAASMALKNVGDISDEPVESSFGYHIIKYQSSPEAGAIPYEDVKETITEFVTQEKQAELWDKIIEEWLAAAEIQRNEFAAPVVME